ncbi:hypothetical protein GA0070610_3070 [Micromonospora echinofusca]|uniref:Uncharacterized protein n=1 Tax=Micromonospora echinofusca TaxID=47858 RepID=A0A1C5GCH4_MICEH|nr:hypothetical protein [Micromonospora echinofusca]SCG16796.1 hypothetical protein GA0070610_3070 [Micromonospora echinofusca]
MSIVEDVGAQVRAAADDLPLAQLALALEKFGLAAERLRWVRQESADPMGVPELSAATEHAETAGYALRVAQEQLSAYLAAIGLAADGSPAPRPQEQQRRPVHDAPREATPGAAAPEQATDVTPRRWWSVRVAELTGGREGPPEQPDEKVDDARELLRRVVGGVRAGDRDRLHAELRRAHADVGLGMAAVAPPLLRELAGELLGHPPRADDLGRLHRELDGRVRDLLPGLPPAVLDTLLTRICRMPPPRRGEAEQPHAADPAVTAGVLTGVLLARLGRDLPTADERDRQAEATRERRAADERDRQAEAARNRADDAEWQRRAAAAKGRAADARERVAAAQQRAAAAHDQASAARKRAARPDAAERAARPDAAEQAARPDAAERTARTGRADAAERTGTPERAGAARDRASTHHRPAPTNDRAAGARPGGSTGGAAPRQGAAVDGATGAGRPGGVWSSPPTGRPARGAGTDPRGRGVDG